MKLTVTLVAIHHEQSPQAMPLGLACLKAALQADPELGRSADCHILDVWPGEPAAQVAGRIVRTRARVVGFTVFSWNLPLVRDCLACLDGQLPGCQVVLGGPEAFNPRLADWPGVAAVIQGEGESAFLEWIRPQAAGLAGSGRLEPAGAGGPGRPGGRCQLIQGRAEDVSRLASPWLSGAIKPADYGGVLWELARGCPFRCTYCFESRSVPGVRPVPLERLEAELLGFARQQVAQVFVLDPTFNADKSRVRTLLALIRRHCPDTHFHFEIRAEFLDEEQARLFAEGPCSLQIGLQSAHPAVLARLGRPFVPEQFRRKIRLLNQSGAIFGLDLMYGLPGDTLEGFGQSIDWALELEPNHLDLFPLSILPGTRLHEDASGLGLDWDEQPPYRVRSGPGFAAADMDRAGRLAAATRLFYCSGRAVGWFMRVCRAMGLRPVELLERFAGWLDRRGGTPWQEPGVIGQAGLPGLQRDFLGSQAALAGQEGLKPVLADLVGFHAAWAALVVDHRESRVVLNYDPDRLNGPEGRKLAAFAGSHRSRPQSWVFRFHRGEPVYHPAGGR